MKKLKRLAAFLLAVCIAVSALGCGPSGSQESTSDSDYRVAMITDSGDITDPVF